MEVLYLLIHEHLLDKADSCGRITTHEAKLSLGKRFCIPKQIQIIILKEMEGKSLLKWESRDIIKLSNKCFNVLENTTKIYKMVGLW